MNRIWMIALVFAVAGCAGHVRPETALTGLTAEIPVTHHCLKEAPPEPTSYADDALPLGKGKGPTRYKLTAAANEQRKAFLAQMHPYMAACR